MLFLRTQELADGTYECRRGRVVLDHHEDADSAVAHLLALAKDVTNVIVFRHLRDGTVEEIARILE